MPKRKKSRSFVFSIFFLAGFFLHSLPALSVVTADFSMSPTSGCKPLVVKFTDLSTGPHTTWTWNFGNGNYSNLQNPSAVYNTPGTYTITLTVSDGTTSDSKSKTVVVFDNPTANFSFTALTFCTGKTVTFNDNSVPGGSPLISWSWDFGDGNAISTTTGTATHSYGLPGTYPVSLIITDGNGCTGNIVKTLTVNPTPLISFTASPVFSCTPPLTVTFTNTGNAFGPATYQWRFGDGTTSSVANPSHTFTSVGSYSVTLIVTTQAGCRDSLTKINYISIGKNSGNFSSSDTAICLGKSITFSGLYAPPALTQTWDFGDGGTSYAANPAYTYTASGVYTVALYSTHTGNCRDSVIKNAYITVLDNPKAKFSASATASCKVPFTVNFTDSSTFTVSRTWDFGNGSTSTAQNPSITYTAAGTYTVTLVSFNALGCTDTFRIPIVIAKPVADFIALPRMGCVPVTAPFSSTGTSTIEPVATYSWDFGNGNTLTSSSPNAVSTYTLSGQYTVKLKIVTAGGCADSVTKNAYVLVGTKPTAGYTYTPTVICFGKSVTFTDTSKNANNWKWLYGDGGSDTNIANPTHTYADTGVFTVIMVAFNNGCPDTVVKTKIITVLPPKPQFTSQLSCVNYYTVNFTNTSAGADSVTWSFGDGTFDTTNNNNPVHTYTTRGVKNIILTAFNKTTGCSFSQAAQIIIAEPIARITNLPDPAHGCVPFTVMFADSSQDANSWYWDAGNGTPTVNNDTMLATYTTKGTYTVTLVITDVNGCKDTLVLNKYVHAFRIDTTSFIASPRTGCVPLNVSFADSIIADSSVVRWIWKWGDGKTDTVFSAGTSHTYTTRGVYTLTLVAQDKNGCLDTAIRINHIIASKPYPALALDTFRCRNELITFNGSSTTGNAPITYSWNFGDGTDSASVSPVINHFYVKDSLYTVTLKVIDTYGCDSTITRNIRIQHPNAVFKDSAVSYGCGTKQMQFLDLSSPFVTSWQWDLGNGATSTLRNPFYTYTSPGSYDVRLIVTNIAGCKDTSLMLKLVVVPGPVATFTFTPATGCVPLTVNFKATGNNISYFTWDFGDGTILYRVPFDSVQHIYYNTIAVTPILILGDTLPNGLLCELPATNLTGSVVATKVMTVSITPPGPILLGEEDVENITIAVTGNGTSSLSYSWVPSTGLSCSDCPNPVVSSAGQSILYKLIVTDLGMGGCIGDDSVEVIFAACTTSVLIPNVFTPNYDGVNDFFNVKGTCLEDANDFHLTIYNRWGEKIYSAEQRKTGWDGRSTTGEPVPEGVYYYYVKAGKEIYTGYIQLLR